MDKQLSLMGIARRAGKLAVGHDAVFDSVRKGRAAAVIITNDASSRHLKELEAAGFEGKIIKLDASMDDAAAATGKRSCIFSLEDEGFTNAIAKSV